MPCGHRGHVGRMALLTPVEGRQLKLFGWFLLIINALIGSAGAVVGKRLSDVGAGWFFVVALLVLVDGAFGLIVGGNIVIVILRRWRESRRGGGGRRRI